MLDSSVRHLRVLYEYHEMDSKPFDLGHFPTRSLLVLVAIKIPGSLDDEAEWPTKYGAA